MAITWKNINTPSFGSANNLLSQSSEQISQGLNQLRGLAKEQTAIEDTNYEAGVDRNTATLQQAINQAGSQEELDAIELDLYDEPKSQSARLRNVLYVLWKQQGENGDFKKFYKQKTEEIIQHFKTKLSDE